MKIKALSAANEFAGKESYCSFKSMMLLLAIVVVSATDALAATSYEIIDSLRYQLDNKAMTASLVAISGNKYSDDVVVPEKVMASDGAEYKVASLGVRCFYECENLTSVTIPSTVKSFGGNCFKGCTSLTTIVVPDSVTSLGAYCFDGCTGLTDITLSSSVTTLGIACFRSCSSLTSIIIPSSVTTMSSDCFYSCNNIQSATFKGKLPSGVKNCKLPTTCSIYVPAAYLDDYKKALGTTYANIYASEDGESGEETQPKQCAAPTISYSDGKLQFASTTAGAKYHYTIADSDIVSDADSDDGTVTLSAAYDISAYATADGYTDSEKTTATLYWINAVDTPTSINHTQMRGIVASSRDGIVTVSGLGQGEEVSFYTTDGTLIGKTTAIGGVASQAVSSYSVVIAKIGGQSIKIAVK